MPIKQVAICDVCQKEVDLGVALDGGPYGIEPKYFICNINHVYCTEKCWISEREAQA